MSLTIRATTLADLDFVLSLETAPENAGFVMGWSREQHAAFLVSPGSAHWLLLEHPAATPVGYVLLAGLEDPNRSVELRRIVVGPKGRGLGRAALRLVKDAAFAELGAHRLWLDVFAFNTRAQALYLSEGFTVEGTLRECVRRGDRYESLVVMSVLDREHGIA